MTIIDNVENYSNRSDNTDNDVFEEEYLHISEDSPIMSAGDEPIRTTHTSTTTSRRVNIKYLTKKTDSSLLSGSKPKFLKLFESARLKESSALLLTCQVVGDPKPDLFWYKNGIEMKSNKRIQNFP